MKVLHLLKSPMFSGAENVACQIIELNKKNNEMEMIYCSVDGPIRDALKERNIPYIPLKKFSVQEIKNVVTQTNPDIIHAHDMHATVMASLVKGKAKLISHIHNNAYASRRISVKSIMFLFASLFCKHIFWVSESAKNGYIFKRFVKKKSSVLYNILDEASLIDKVNCDNADYEYDIVYLGRLSYEKNPQRMLKIVAEVVKQFPDVKAGIIGSGQLEKEIEEIISKNNLNNNVKMLGYISNPLKILSCAKVMIMTSRWEGLPMCALEAMALGVPIVSTPTDGLKYIIKNDINGFLSDDDNELERKIINIFENECIYKKLKQGQHNVFNEYNNTEKYIGNILEAYNR